MFPFYYYGSSGIITCISFFSAFKIELLCNHYCERGGGGRHNGREMCYNGEFELGSVMAVVGPSKSGKSTFINKLLQSDIIFPQPEHYFYFYGQIIPKDKLNHVIYKQGLPNVDSIPSQSVVVLDDLMHEVGKNDSMLNLFTRVAHHRQCFIIYVTQNLFHQSKNCRSMNLNVHYLVLFKNVRDRTIIHKLAMQMYPKNIKFLVDAFEEATSEPYTYLFMDLQANTPSIIRIRSDLFNEMGQKVFINKMEMKPDENE